MREKIGLPDHAGSVKRRSPLPGSTSERPSATRTSSPPSFAASRVTVRPWPNAAARPATVSPIDGTPTTSPPSGDWVSTCFSAVLTH